MNLVVHKCVELNSPWFALANWSTTTSRSTGTCRCTYIASPFNRSSGIVFLAPFLSFTSFFLFSILTPLFAYLIFYHSYYLTTLPFCIILFSFFVLCGAPSFTFVAVCLGLYIPIFAILALLSFLLQFLSFKSLSICRLFYFSFPFHFMSPFLFFVSFSFLFSFSSPFPFPFLLFPLPLFPLLFFFLFLTPLLVTFWRPLVVTRGASARYAPPKIRHCYTVKTMLDLTTMKKYNL